MQVSYRRIQIPTSKHVKRAKATATLSFYSNALSLLDDYYRESGALSGKKILVVYYSCFGLEVLAEALQF